jgi:hypothetical protein
MRILLLLAVFAATATSITAQQVQPVQPCYPYEGTLVNILNPHGRRFKIKTVVGVSSATAREADYVEFQTMENIYSVGDPDKKTPPVLLFEKGTPIYGVVSVRKSRHFPFKRGKLELVLQPLVNWNGEKYELGIARHGVIRATDKPKRRNDPCKETDIPNPCVAGRGNAEVAPLVAATAAGGAAALAALADEEETLFIAATAFFAIAKDVGNLLNGTDVGIAKDEIFDLVIENKKVCALKKAEAQARAAKAQKTDESGARP